MAWTLAELLDKRNQCFDTAEIERRNRQLKLAQATGALLPTPASVVHTPSVIVQDRCGDCIGCLQNRCGRCNFCRRGEMCKEKICVHFAMKMIQYLSYNFETIIGCTNCRGCRQQECRVCVVCLDKKYFHKVNFGDAMCIEKVCNFPQVVHQHPLAFNPNTSIPPPPVHTLSNTDPNLIQMINNNETSLPPLYYNTPPPTIPTVVTNTPVATINPTFINHQVATIIPPISANAAKEMDMEATQDWSALSAFYIERAVKKQKKLDEKRFNLQEKQQTQLAPRTQAPAQAHAPAQAPAQAQTTAQTTTQSSNQRFRLRRAAHQNAQKAYLFPSFYENEKNKLTEEELQKIILLPFDKTKVPEPENQADLTDTSLDTSDYYTAPVQTNTTPIPYRCTEPWNWTPWCENYPLKAIVHKMMKKDLYEQKPTPFQIYWNDQMQQADTDVYMDELMFSDYSF